ncbi:hypothetical protein FD754_006440 [Muntiacus muntjak]|uniref:PH domain-containing protein n=1 Tax=Muntiacus muntjak TaxID=9888 RepID=A0A5N3WLF2_MUNMU|nr:hypothetical protein FD754_006440 [Muntiacus muntjak]
MASIMEGPLSKWTNVMKGWQYRWFVLDYNAGLLSYYTPCSFLTVRCLLGGKAGRGCREVHGCSRGLKGSVSGLGVCGCVCLCVCM